MVWHARGFSRVSRWAGPVTVLTLALLPVAALSLSEPIAAADEEVLEAPQEPGGARGRYQGRGQEPETAAPDPDGAYEDGTPPARERWFPPPGGCQFKDGPLELLV